MELSNIQNTILEATEPIIFVSSASGSGKTRVLTEKVRQSIKKGKSVVAFTFTNMASGEMKKRLQIDNNDNLFIGTIHSYCAHLLLRNGVKEAIKYMNDEKFDAAVIGTGPAGLSAAVTLKIRNKNIILFGSRELSSKLEKAHEIQNYLGFPAVKGGELAENFRTHIENLGIEITEDQITACYSMGEYFSLTSKANKTYSAKAVILATGVNFGKPYEGEEKFLGRGVSYCATCDAPLYKGKKAAVIAQSEKEEGEAEFLAEVCEKVFYVPLYKMEKGFSAGNIQIVNDEVVQVIDDNIDFKLSLENSIKAINIVEPGIHKRLLEAYKK